MRIIAFIPARYNSTRLPGKPLLKIGEKSMIQWTWEACNRHPAINRVVILTEDKRVMEEVIGFGGEVIMTSASIKTGTDRIASVVRDFDCDVILNIQGDEPGISQKKLGLLINKIQLNDCEIGTLCVPILDSDTLFDYNKVKVVRDKSQKALYFSRQAIPAVRDKSYEQWIQEGKYFLHYGIYAFKKEVFLQLTKLPQSYLEINESLEQLRWLDNGYSIYVYEINEPSPGGIDTVEDLKKARKIYKNFYGK